MKGVHILDVLTKTPGLYHVPELRNLLIYIFWGVGGAFWGGLGGHICGEWSRIKEVHIHYVLAKTPCLYHVPELRNLLIYIFWGVWGDWGGVRGIKYEGSGHG